MGPAAGGIDRLLRHSFPVAEDDLRALGVITPGFKAYVLQRAFGCGFLVEQDQERFWVAKFLDRRSLVAGKPVNRLDGRGCGFDLHQAGRRAKGVEAGDERKADEDAPGQQRCDAAQYNP